MTDLQTQCCGLSMPRLRGKPKGICGPRLRCDIGRKLTPSIGPSMNQCASIRSWREPDRQGSHTGQGPSLIDEDQTLSFDAALIFCPLAAPACYVGTIGLSSRNALRSRTYRYERSSTSSGSGFSGQVRKAGNEPRTAKSSFPIRCASQTARSSPIALGL